MRVHTVNNNSWTSNCQCSLFSKKNPLIWIFCMSELLIIPINLYKWISSVLKCCTGVEDQYCTVIKIAGNVRKIFSLLTRCVTGSELLIIHFWTWSDSSQPGGVSRRRECPAGAAAFSRCYSWGSTQSCHLLPQTGEVHDGEDFVIPFEIAVQWRGSQFFQKSRNHHRILGTRTVTWSKIM